MLISGRICASKQESDEKQKMDFAFKIWSKYSGEYSQAYPIVSGIDGDMEYGFLEKSDINSLVSNDVRSKVNADIAGTDSASESGNRVTIP